MNFISTNNIYDIQHVIISRQISYLIFDAWFWNFTNDITFLYTEPSIDSEPSAGMEPPVNTPFSKYWTFKPYWTKNEYQTTSNEIRTTTKWRTKC